MKSIKILVISFGIIILLSHNIFAFDDLFDTGKDWISTGESNAAYGLDTGILQDGSETVYNILLVIATVVAVIGGTVLGIKFMTAGIGEKAEVKKSLFPYLISCIVVFGSLGIWKLMVIVMKNF